MSTQQNSGRARWMSTLSPVFNGLLVALLVVLTLWVAVAMGGQEQALVAVVAESTETPASPAATATLPAATATSLPAEPPTALPPPASDTPGAPLPTLPTGQAATTQCVPTGNWRPYIVQAGDSLQALARRFNTTDYKLMQANCLGSNRTLWVGQQIYVPNVPTPVPCGHPSWWVKYTIQPGDTLSSLADRLGISIATLKNANCLTQDTIFAGRTLWVPHALPARPVASATPRPTWGASATPSPTLLPPGSVTAEPSGTPGSEPPTGTPPGPDLPPTSTGEAPDTPTATDEPPTATTEPPTNTPPPPDTPVPPTNTSPPPDTPVPPPDTAVPPTATDTD